MKHLKKCASLFLILLLCMALSACGKKSIEEVTGNTYECKQFSALCPEGWVNVPVTELNNKNNIAIDHLRFCKVDAGEGQELGGLVYSNAYIDIGHYPATAEIYEKMDSHKDVQEVSLEINGVKWKGHTGELAGYKEAYLWKEGSVEWQASIRLSDNDGDIEIDDIDLQAILASIK
ncbi:MAG: hypothetical protein IKP88_12985 [Lachnospiraceae bacterium]|nr:hypothetical protein [Lachnospiraceae bacterium]